VGGAHIELQMVGGLARTVLAATTGKVPGRAVYVGL